MLFQSTRGESRAVDLSGIMLSALASDGGLYVPIKIDAFSNADIASMQGLSYQQLAAVVLPKLLGNGIQRPNLERMIANAYSSFDEKALAPLNQLEKNIWLLELFHGPTFAFKDYALQFLGECLNDELARQKKRCVVVGATSGDTGSAAIEACRHCPSIELFMLHPKGRTSAVQRRQMTTVSAPNIHNIAVQGTFDDCQRLVKVILNDPTLKSETNLTAVNSINWLRIAAQVVYYFYAALQLGSPSRWVSYAVPTGNFGNVYAGHIARRLGLPIKNLIIGSNRNDIITRFFESGVMQSQTVDPSLTPSMDIQVSSNFERFLFELYDRDGVQVDALMRAFGATGKYSVPGDILAKAHELFSAYRFSDEQTLEEIARVYKASGVILDPHTAIGVAAANKEPVDPDVPVIVVGTAHPAKFPQAIQKAIGQDPTTPEPLQRVMTMPEFYNVIDSNVDYLRDRIRTV